MHERAAWPSGSDPGRETGSQAGHPMAPPDDSQLGYSPVPMAWLVSPELQVVGSWRPGVAQRVYSELPALRVLRATRELKAKHRWGQDLPPASRMDSPGAGQQAAAVHSAAPETRVMLDEMDPEPGRARGPEAGGSGAALPSEAVRGPAPAGGARLEAVRQVPALVAVAGPRQQRPGSVPTVPTHSHVGLRTPRCTRRIGPALRPRAP